MGILDIVDKRRRTKIPIRKLPAPVEWMLKNATSEQLNYLNRMAKSEDFSTFVNFVAHFKEYNVYEVYNYRYRNFEDLALFKAAKVGELAGLDALLMSAQGAFSEIERRRRMKEIKE